MRRCSPLAALLVLCAPAAAQEAYTSDAYGFTVQPPAGWVCYSAEGSSEGVIHQVALYPRRDPKTPGTGPSLLIQVLRWDGTTSLESYRDAGVRIVRPKALGPVTTGPRPLLGAEAPGLACAWAGGPGEVLALACVYARGSGFVFALTTTRATGDEASEQALAGALASFTLRADDARSVRLRALAARCGSQVPWARGWVEAAAKARREGKLVLVLFRRYTILDLPDLTLSGPLTDPDFVALLQERFVVTRLGQGDPAPFRATFGLDPEHSWGSAVFFATPEGELLAHTGVHEASHLAEVARSVLAGREATEGVGTPEDEAERALRRGEHARAGTLLEGATSARAHLLRARLLEGRRDAVGALRALEAASQAGPSPELAPELARQLALAAALLQLRLGRVEPARRGLAAVAQDVAAPGAGQALYWLGALAAVAGDLQGGGHWDRLCEARPDDPWAWKAAACLLGAGSLVNGGELLAWPPEPAFAGLRLLPLAPLDAVDEVEAGARAWLLREQRPDGSWGVPTEELSLVRVGYTRAVTAIAAASLLGDPDPRSRAAVERALARVLQPRAAREEQATYAVWADTFELRLLVRAARALPARADGLRAEVQARVDRLCGRQRANGGWPYFLLATDPDGSGLTTSFLSAAIVLALDEARAQGAEVPDGALRRAGEYLLGMRGADGQFAYAPDAGGGDARAAAGRSPLCALALDRALRATGREGDLPGVRRALALFVAHQADLRAEVGKDLCHTGPLAQASYYFLYDHLYAAEAVQALPEAERPPLRAALRAGLLSTRLADGSFQDMPSLGRAYGSAMALSTLAAAR